jgi:hypothetical protein
LRHSFWLWCWHATAMGRERNMNRAIILWLMSHCGSDAGYEGPANSQQPKAIADAVPGGLAGVEKPSRS